MSIISPNSSTSSSGATGTSGKSAATGFAALTSQDFMTMLLAELKNQDPTQPVSNSDLLNQLSQMQSLQSNVELKSTLSSFASNQQISGSTTRSDAADIKATTALGCEHNEFSIG